MKRDFFLTTCALLFATGTARPAAATDGAGLYEDHCAGCHGPLATSGKNGATLSRIEKAIADDAGGMGSVGLKTVDLRAIARALAAPARYDATNFTVADRKWQPAPTGHAPGKDNGPGEAIHHPGEDCGICHTPGGKAAKKVWTMAGTVYDSREARLPLPGAEVMLQNGRGEVLSMTSNELGNFWTDKPFSSDPTLTDPAKWHYKAWVRVGGRVRPMVSIAPVGSPSGIPRMSCSMHHAGMGSRGGLWAVSQSTLKSYPAAGLSYRKHIFPILRSKCAPCHIPGDTTARGPAGESPFDSSHGLDLMTYGGSSVLVPSYTPHGAPGPVPDRTWTKRGVRSVVDTRAPASSLLLLKTVDGGTHGGGNFWATRDLDYKALLQWIAEGAKEN